MNNSLEKRNQPMSEAGRKMDQALAKLGISTGNGIIHRSGRLIFGLDLTSSREASLYRARIATAAMFDTLRTIGTVAVKLIYYRGGSECRASDWHDDPSIVSRSMQRLTCEAGYTQIRRILRVALEEPEHIDGVVFIGDSCEEEADELTGLAAKLGERRMPLYIFHECADADQKSLTAKPLFKRLAELSGGVYCEFKPNSAAVLQELLTTVGAFSVASQEGVRQIRPGTTPEARQLQNRLLLPAGSVHKTK